MINKKKRHGAATQNKTSENVWRSFNHSNSNDK
jgi:hypothetical protein